MINDENTKEVRKTQKKPYNKRQYNTKSKRENKTTDKMKI